MAVDGWHWLALAVIYTSGWLTIRVSSIQDLFVPPKRLARRWARIWVTPGRDLEGFGYAREGIWRDLGGFGYARGTISKVSDISGK